MPPLAVFFTLHFLASHSHFSSTELMIWNEGLLLTIPFRFCCFSLAHSLLLPYPSRSRTLTLSPLLFKATRCIAQICLEDPCHWGKNRFILCTWLTYLESWFPYNFGVVFIHWLFCYPILLRDFLKIYLFTLLMASAKRCTQMTNESQITYKMWYFTCNVQWISIACLWLLF